ncbi:uncharacterized protein METZ01_LOCUS180765 [marine metagenome]|mgnify:FL=1|uniref:Enoyl-CoA hydratase n=1 Tax=marine metagenome TaxID=408172 RepID=A0A382CQL7_9ZZZZ|tara:strand:+ start:83 stop:745 length:663 start_codon:yes stop_codon:yes gene_type:complete
MPELDLEKNGDVFVVTLDNPSTGNAINTASLSAHREILAELETVKENSAVVVTSSDPKSWCVGLDFDWIREQSEQEFGETFREVEEVFERWALLSLPTIACITGHCIAGGAFLASVMDFRLMRADRGWFAFTEIDVKIPPSPKLYLMADLLPNKQAVRELLLTGRRVGGDEAQKLGLVDESHLQEKLLPRAMEFAQQLAQKDLETYRKIKHLLKRDLVEQ